MAAAVEPILSLDSSIFNVTFHPNKHFIVSGHINGDLVINDYRFLIEEKYHPELPRKEIKKSISRKKYAQNNSVKRSKGSDFNIVSTKRIHLDSIRDVCFNKSGTGINVISSVSSDRSLRSENFETNKELYHIKNAHEVAINKVLRLDDHTITTGDDNGVIKLWDERISSATSTSTSDKAVITYSDHEDYISQFMFVDYKKTLIASSGDGMIMVYDVRKSKCKASSTSIGEDILCMTLCKGGTRLVCGCQDGSLNVFSWDFWANPSDRFLGHPTSVDTIISLPSSSSYNNMGIENNDEGFVITGSSDGFIRLVQIQPNRFIEVIGETFLEGSEEGLPIESLAISHDAKWIASSSHDEKIHFWNKHISLLNEHEISSDEEYESISNDEDEMKHRISSKHHREKVMTKPEALLEDGEAGSKKIFLDDKKRELDKSKKSQKRKFSSKHQHDVDTFFADMI